ncbi:MAG TPA: phospholipase D family protein [Dehalococcoidia bacterium]|nr:phospholipase D family protein [Dehalococcoidia bacterium]
MANKRRSVPEAAGVFVERFLGPRVLRPLGRLKTRSAHRHVGVAAREPGQQPDWSVNEPRWSPYGTPPRLHNRLMPLIDGETFLERLYAEIASAGEYVYIAGWCLTPHLPLLRASTSHIIDSRLVTVLGQASGRVPVRVLLWGGAPFVIHPTSDYVEQVAKTLTNEAGGDLICPLDDTATWSHTHHQKAIVVDGQWASVGGIDLTTYSGDRWDQRGHRLRAGVNWHDAAMSIEGELVADVESNFRQRWLAVTGDGSLPSVQPRVDATWSTPAQVLRTIPAGDYDFAQDGEYDFHHSYLELLQRSRRFVYLESQYLWSPEVMDALLDLVKQPPSPSFRIVIVLPARATSGKWDNDKHVEALREVDGGRNIVEVYSLYTSGPTSGERPFRYRPVYVHAKLAIVDDEWLIVGSANLNDRSLHSDSEIGVLAHDADLARKLRLDLWSEHLNRRPQDLEARDVTDVVDSEWRGRATKNGEIITEGVQPLECGVHFYQSGAPPGAWILEESESLTFEH